MSSNKGFIYFFVSGSHIRTSINLSHQGQFCTSTRVNNQVYKIHGPFWVFTQWVNLKFHWRTSLLLEDRHKKRDFWPEDNLLNRCENNTYLVTMTDISFRPNKVSQKFLTLEWKVPWETFTTIGFRTCVPVQPLEVFPFETTPPHQNYKISVHSTQFCTKVPHGTKDRVTNSQGHPCVLNTE